MRSKEVVPWDSTTIGITPLNLHTVKSLISPRGAYFFEYPKRGVLLEGGLWFRTHPDPGTKQKLSKNGQKMGVKWAIFTKFSSNPL